jgi:hypothetical protein
MTLILFKPRAALRLAFIAGIAREHACPGLRFSSTFNVYDDHNPRRLQTSRPQPSLNPKLAARCLSTDLRTKLTLRAHGAVKSP